MLGTPAGVPARYGMLQSKVQAIIRQVVTAAAPEEGSHIAGQTKGGLPSSRHCRKQSHSG